MTIHEFGKENDKTIVLIHPAAVMWDYFEYVIPLLQDRYRVIVPALPGYDEDAPGDFTSVGQIAAELVDQYIEYYEAEDFEDLMTYLPLDTLIDYEIINRIHNIIYGSAVIKY